jgi:Carboxypeptidase regulatory-like domain
MPRYTRLRIQVLFAVSALFFVQLLEPGTAAQQTKDTGSVAGQVVVSGGTSVPDATVVVTNDASGQSKTATTDASGDFKIGNFPAGRVSIKVSAFGVSPIQLTNLTVKAGETLTQQIVLKTRGEVEGITSAAVATAVTPEALFGPDSNTGDSTNLVTVSENAVAGPMGYVLTPSLGAAVQSQTAQQQAFVASQKFNFPSIIFYISAAPLVNLPSTPDATRIKAAQETDRNPLWLDASFTLSLWDANGPLPNACSDGSVQVLGLMPQQTVSAMKNQTIADVASAVNDAAGAMASFYPGSQGEVTSATKALNVVFQDIFPPKPVAYEYSNMTDNCNFGWYFRPNTSATATGSSGEASILGIQTGIILLRTSKNITKISVNGRSLSAWNKPPSSNGNSKASDLDIKNKLFVSNDRLIGTIEMPNLADIDYDNLTSLAMFPSLIPRSEAKQILHVKQDADFVAFATANKLVGTNATFDYVTNASLSAFLSLGAPAAGSQPQTTPTPDVAAAVKGKGAAGANSGAASGGKSKPAPAPKPAAPGNK